MWKYTIFEMIKNIFGLPLKTTIIHKKILVIGINYRVFNENSTSFVPLIHEGTFTIMYLDIVNITIK